MLDLTREYYTWWIDHVLKPGVFSSERTYSLATMLEMGKANDKEWLLSAVKAIRFAVMKSTANNVNNVEARKLGRAAEKKVFNLLLQNGWDIKYLTSQEIRPKYGQSATNWDIIACFQQNKNRFIEIKAISNDCPFIHIQYKHKIKIDLVHGKMQNHFTVFVYKDTIYWVRSSNIKYIGYVSSYGDPDLKYIWVVDPSCLRVFV